MHLRSLSARMVEKQATILFDSLDKLDQIPKLLKPLNLMVIAPFTGFHVFSTAATCLYIAAYPKSYENTFQWRCYKEIPENGS